MKAVKVEGVSHCFQTGYKAFWHFWRMSQGYWELISRQGVYGSSSTVQLLSCSQIGIRSTT